jgi:hypothetical protein
MARGPTPLLGRLATHRRTTSRWPSAPGSTLDLQAQRAGLLHLPPQPTSTDGRSRPSHRKPLGRRGHLPVHQQQTGLDHYRAPRTTPDTQTSPASASVWTSARKSCTLSTSIGSCGRDRARSNEVIGIPPLRIRGRGAGSRDLFPRSEESLQFVRAAPAGGRAGVDGFRRHTSRRVGVLDDLIVFDSA